VGIGSSNQEIHNHQKRERSEERHPGNGAGLLNSDTNLKEKDALDDFMRPNIPI